ncbi:hypothetical protein D3C72_1678320 [compost metagenome]
MAGDVDFRVDLLQRVEGQFHALLYRMRKHLQRIAHPGVRQANDPRLIVTVVEQVGAASQAVSQGHAHQVATGFWIFVFPEGAIDHHKSLR